MGRGGVDHRGVRVLDHADGLRRRRVRQAQKGNVRLVQRRLSRRGILPHRLVKRDQRDVLPGLQPLPDAQSRGPRAAVDKYLHAFRISVFKICVHYTRIYGEFQVKNVYLCVNILAQGRRERQGTGNRQQGKGGRGNGEQATGEPRSLFRMREKGKGIAAAARPIPRYNLLPGGRPPLRDRAISIPNSQFPIPNFQFFPPISPACGSSKLQHTTSPPRASKIANIINRK